jgi:RHS repeat-associated protein
VGNRLSLADNNGFHNYIYDNVYRLSSVTNPAENYSYDPVGNRNPLSQTYDSGNRLLDDGTYTYTYDHDGNMTKKVKKVGGDTTTYSYNSEDQLIGVVTPTQTISYKYDALGRRIEKNVAGTISKYIYDGEDIIEELDGNHALIATYTHGPGIDEPICLEKNNQKYYYIADGLGSITAIVDANENIVQTYKYDSFGNILSTTGSLTQPYTYTGREYDSETGLFYYRARYYDSHTGRFLQEDPIGFVGGLNLYSYTGSNPINNTDPIGLFTVPIPFTNIWIPAGEEAGGNAAMYWANRQAQTGNWLYGIPGVFATLWTCDTSDKTLTVLSLAGGFRWAGTKMEPVHIGFDMPFTRINIIHYGEHLKWGEHIGIWFNKTGNALLHIYKNRIYIKW